MIYTLRQFFGGFVLIFGLMAAGYLPASTLPDAGTITQQLEQLKQRELPIPVFPKQIEKVVELPPLDPAKSVLINELVFEGNESIPSTRLNIHFANSVGQKLDFARMKNLTEQVQDFYQKEGLWVKAILPQQTLENGKLIIRIFEGRLGKILIETALPEGEELRFSEDRIREFIVNGQEVGKTFSIVAFEEAVKNLNAVPGISATAVLRAGENQGETDVVINAANAPMVAGSFGLDRNGGDGTGYNQGTLSASFDGLFGVGDQVTTMLMKSKELEVKSLGGSFPLSHGGVRLGLNATDVRMSKEPLSRSILVNISKPFSQSVDFNATGTASLTRNFTWTGSDKNQQKDADVLVLNSVFSWPSTLLGFDSVNSVNLTMTSGWQYLHANNNPDSKDFGRAGLYGKLGFNLNKTISLTSVDQLAFTLMGQYALNNLESREKFGITGLAAVRAYPAGEVSGDHGYFFSAQYQRQLNSFVNVRTYFDHGFVQENQNPWSTEKDNAGKNTYPQFSGVGVGATINHPKFSINADLATRLGNNPFAASDTGKDQDGTLKKVRAWLSVTIPF